jgi:hypothetical protein
MVRNMSNDYMWQQEVLAMLAMIHGTLEEMKEMMKGDDDETGYPAEAHNPQIDHRFQPDSAD